MTTPNDEIIERLRLQVEARHREALAAIEILRKGLQPRNGSFRKGVLKALTDEWQSVDVIADVSGIDAARVRGVLYARPLVGTRFESQRVDSEVAFRKKHAVKITGC